MRIFALMKRMMNRSLAVLALMFAGMGAVKAQGFELENGKAEHTFYPDATAPVDCTIHFKNLKKSAIVFAYEKLRAIKSLSCIFRSWYVHAMICKQAANFCLWCNAIQ